MDREFKSAWVSNGADTEMITYAEQEGQYMANNGLTNSKIRSIYGEIKRIQMGSFDSERASFLLLRPKVAYALGRDKYNKGLQRFKFIFDNAANVVNDQKSFNNFCDLFEAILAYHKAYGGKD
ncbi:MAG: type III-A CRISPR-associated protein Csm2 [Caldisericia bacterium]|nr:type III-A CRISPR-associated protein Csm2 [Caldisericia bacterium]MDD4428862.1 type III-A CRISPR-associated protein Csm2 [Paludibacter sp.]